jgi:hypothetical protein
MADDYWWANKEKTLYWGWPADGQISMSTTERDDLRPSSSFRTETKVYFGMRRLYVRLFASPGCLRAISFIHFVQMWAASGSSWPFSAFDGYKPWLKHNYTIHSNALFLYLNIFPCRFDLVPRTPGHRPRLQTLWTTFALVLWKRWTSWWTKQSR